MGEMGEVLNRPKTDKMGSWRCSSVVELKLSTHESLGLLPSTKPNQPTKKPQLKLSMQVPAYEEKFLPYRLKHFRSSREKEIGVFRDISQEVPTGDRVGGQQWW